MLWAERENSVALFRDFTSNSYILRLNSIIMHSEWLNWALTYPYAFAFLLACVCRYFFVDNWTLVFHSERVKQRLALYHGAMPIFMEFTDDVEETFSQALKLLLVTKRSLLLFLFYLICLPTHTEIYLFIVFYLQNKGLVSEGQYVTLVQSGAQPIWRRESTHHIQVRKVQNWCMDKWEIKRLLHRGIGR